MTYTAASLAEKVEWEGGIEATLEYGVKAEDIEPGLLRDLWAKAQAIYYQLEPLIHQIQGIFDDAHEEE